MRTLRNGVGSGRLGTGRVRTATTRLACHDSTTARISAKGLPRKAVERACRRDRFGRWARYVSTSPTMIGTRSFTSTSRSISLERLAHVIVMVVCIGVASAMCLGDVAAAPGAAHAVGQLYFGFVYPETPHINALRTYEMDIGKNVSLVLWYRSWMEQGTLQPFPAGDMEAVRLHGAIPVLAWQPESYPPKAQEPDFSLAAIAGGKWDEYLRQYATAAKQWGHPFFLRFASEMNGSWIPWSEWANGNAAGQFITMWRHVHDIFTAQGATNVTWVWCPNVDRGDAIPMGELYPGDAYVDWLGMDGYNFGSALHVPWTSFAGVFQSTYDRLIALTRAPKPIMIGETGSIEAGGSKAQWITDALTQQLPTHFSRVKALIWFNMSDGQIDLRIDTSPQSLAAFRAAVAPTTYQSNTFRTLSQSPIPSPEQVVLPPPVAGATPVPIVVGDPARKLSQIAQWLGTAWGLAGLFAALLVGFLSLLVYSAVADSNRTKQSRGRKL